jgi:hypothetical protein
MWPMSGKRPDVKVFKQNLVCISHLSHLILPQFNYPNLFPFFYNFLSCLCFPSFYLFSFPSFLLGTSSERTPPTATYLLSNTSLKEMCEGTVLKVLKEQPKIRSGTINRTAITSVTFPFARTLAVCLREKLCLVTRVNTTVCVGERQLTRNLHRTHPPSVSWKLPVTECCSKQYTKACIQATHTLTYSPMALSFYTSLHS